MLVGGLLGLSEAAPVRETVSIGEHVVWRVPEFIAAIHVIAGTAWLTIDDEDFIVERGQYVFVEPKDADIRISAVAISRTGHLLIEAIYA